MKRSPKFGNGFLRRPFFNHQLNYLWGFLGFLAWTYCCWDHGRKDMGFSFLIWGKGLPLLAGAILVFQAARKDFSFLGMFPLVWLGVSKFQWEICGSPSPLWIWLVLFLAVLLIIFLVPDGKKLLPGLTPFWAVQAILLKQSYLLPLGFLTAERGRFKNPHWIRWGGICAAILIFLVSRGWVRTHWNWMELYDLLITDRYYAFLILTWLGLVSFPRKGTARYAVFQGMFFTAGFVFWTRDSLQIPLETQVLRWVLVFLAGFGLESFRQDLMDPSWHGRAVWFVMGLALCWGVV